MLALTRKQKDVALAKRLRALGIKMPELTIEAARLTKTPLPIACALLMMETGGGRNVYGHDPVDTAPKGAEVTRANYLAYKGKRQARGMGGMQGVGPTQLTWYSYQDAADKIGGCWNPLANMQIGFALVKAKIARNGIKAGFAAYNGSGPAAVAYGARAAALEARFASALKVKPVVPKKRVGAALTLRNWWKAFVYGDTDCDRALLVKLAIVARARGKGFKIFVRSGKRSYAEQVALYAHYKRYGFPLAARPGHSNHEPGHAADCQLVYPDGRTVDVGRDKACLSLLRKNDLTLPVSGEPWHVERKG